ncbi:MAG TPA: Flp pilus assembly protein CpaB [Candidatus Eisenbacteria bacterium]|nr:Flp pilus assembly protein CpaB [Candidatus Eisenbacteria bacterium]
MSRSKTTLTLALVLGLLAALAGYAGLKATAAQVAMNTSKSFVPVVVTATDLTFGTKLDRAQLRLVRYPKESVPAGAFSNIDSVAGQTTKIFLAAREPITDLKLSSRGGGLSMLVHPGMRATSLEVNQVSGVSGFVLPGDKIDVLCTIDGHGQSEETVTKTILQNAEVLASGQKTAQQDNKPITVQAVTILVDPAGAEKLALGLHEGRLHLVLRNPEDSDTVQVASINTPQMLSGLTPSSTVAVRKSAVKAHKAPTAPAETRPAVRPTREAKPTVRIIREAKVTEQAAPKDSAQ